MKQTIQDELKEFEKTYDITIISARDTGSRAWNLHSPESDYDVSFIFLQNHEDYITTSGYKQNIDRETQTEYDIEYNSWNLDRFLSLLKGSNPAAIEFLQSNEIYYEPREFEHYMHNLESHAQDHFKPLALMMHHHSLAKSQHERYLAPAKDHSYKRHLYAIRSLLYREYIKDTQQLPSLDFPKFFENQQMHFGSWRNYSREINNMIGKKKNGAGDNTVRTRKLAEKIDRALDDEISDEKKKEYARQNIQTEFINHLTKSLINEINKNPCTWKKWLSTFKKNMKP